MCAETRYRTIVADPPWQITMKMGAGGRRARATEVPYSMLSIDEIKALPVADLAADEAHLWLWATRRLFREGEAAAVVRAWGFEPVGEIIWGLRNPGMGGFNGNGHEPVLIARRLALPEERATGRGRLLASALRPRQGPLGEARRVPRSRGARESRSASRDVRPPCPLRLGLLRGSEPRHRRSGGRKCRMSR
jgi:hypothetical protein